MRYEFTQDVDPNELRKTMRLCFASPRMTSEEIERRVGAFLDYAKAMSHDLSRRWIGNCRNRITAACACLEMPGRAALLLLPAGDADWVDPGRQLQLVRHVAQLEANRDVSLLQALLETDDETGRTMLLRAGFREIAVLRYLECDLQSRHSREPDPPTSLIHHRVQWTDYSADTHSLFRELIQQTYRDGMDCPSLCGMRRIEDVIASHKAAGRFDAKRWRMLLRDGKPAACILFGEHPLRPSLELVYMGVHPEYRHLSIGRYVLNSGLYRAGAENKQEVTLAVDSNNAPALRIYGDAGFRETDLRRALVLPIDLNPCKT